MSDDTRTAETHPTRTPWNKGKLTGPKPPLKVREIWAIRIRLQLAERLRDLALFNLAIDSTLRGCDLVALRVRDLAHGGTVAHRAIVLQHKTQQPVQFERPVGRPRPRPGASRVACASLGYVPSPLPRHSDQGPYSARSPGRSSFPRYGCRVSLCIVLFELC